jgi:hypothetical protein
LGGGEGAVAILQGMRIGEVGAGRIGLIPLALILFVVVAEGHVPVLGEGFHVHLARAEGAVAVVELVGAHGLVGQVHVVVADAHLVGAGHGQPHEVGTYARHKLAISQAVAKPALVAVHLQLGIHVVAVPLGVAQRPQLGQVPVATPDGVGIDKLGLGAGATGHQLAYLAAVLRVSAARVAGNAAT